MDFFSIVVFLGLYYIRPQEWMEWVNFLRPVQLVMGLALLSMVMKYRREGSFHRDLFRTPHDWILLAYMTWLVTTAPNVRDTFLDVYSHLLFYLVTVQALTKIKRIQSYLNWWLVFIVAVAALAIAGEFGFDPIGSTDLTNGRMMGRLVLNTSIFNNPNALGHSIVPAVVMIYFILFWNRPVFMKVATIPVMAIPLWCIFMTGSKGAYVAGFATVVTALIYRRPKTVQILIVALALTAGVAGMKLLPRMEDMENAKKEGGIQGRLLAFQFGLDMIKTRDYGVGYRRFVPAFEERFHFSKGAHSSYVQVGAELGYTGLALFLGILYCCLRTLITAKTVNDEQERARRILFVLLISFIVSSWMIGWSYRATFFLMIACIAAFHRQLLATTKEAEMQLALAETEPKTIALVITGLHAKSETDQSTPPVTPRVIEVKEGNGDKKPFVSEIGIKWNRIGWVDLVAIGLLTVLTLKFWQFVMRHI